MYEDAVVYNKDDQHGRLPIHHALLCDFPAASDDRAALPRLTMAMHCRFPKGAECRDHKGELPLHLALRRCAQEPPPRDDATTPSTPGINSPPRDGGDHDHDRNTDMLILVILATHPGAAVGLRSR